MFPQPGPALPYTVSSAPCRQLWCDLSEFWEMRSIVVHKDWGIRNYQVAENGVPPLERPPWMTKVGKRVDFGGLLSLSKKLPLFL